MRTLLYGCMAWAPHREHYCTGCENDTMAAPPASYRVPPRAWRQLLYAQAKKTGCQSAESIVRQRRLLFAGALAEQPDRRLLKRLAFGTVKLAEVPEG